MTQKTSGRNIIDIILYELIKVEFRKFTYIPHKHDIFIRTQYN